MSDPTRNTSTASQIGDVFVGLSCIVFGLAILGGLTLLGQLQPKDPWHAAGVLAGAVLYSLVGELFILVGLQSLFGPQAWVERLLSRSLGGVVLAMVIVALMLVGLAVVILW